MALDNLKMSAAGPDGLPSWFIKIAAPGLALPVSHLFNLSIIQSHVPSQWKHADITPISKVPQPKTCSDYRPISLTVQTYTLLSYGKTYNKNFHLPLYNNT